MAAVLLTATELHPAARAIMASRMPCPSCAICVLADRRSSLRSQRRTRWLARRARTAVSGSANPILGGKGLREGLCRTRARGPCEGCATLMPSCEGVPRPCNSRVPGSSTSQSCAPATAGGEASSDTSAQGGRARFGHSRKGILLPASTPFTSLAISRQPSSSPLPIPFCVHR